MYMVYKWGKVFRIIPEFSILRLSFTESQPQNAKLGSLYSFFDSFLDCLQNMDLLIYIL